MKKRVPPGQASELQLPSAEAVKFEGNLLAEGFFLVVEENLEELAPKEYPRRVTNSPEDLAGEEFTFIWKE